MSQPPPARRLARRSVLLVALLVVASLLAGMTGAFGRSYGSCFGYGESVGYAAFEACGDAHEAAGLPPSAGFYPSEVRVGENRMEAFGHDPSNEDNDPTAWAWDVGADGSVDSTEAEPVLTFTEEQVGTDVDIRLTVTFADGRQASTLRAVRVVRASPPTVQLHAQGQPTVGQPVAFQVSAHDGGDNEPTGYAWSFGDGAEATTENPTHTYAAAGRFRVQVTVTFADGQVVTDVAYVTVREPAAATAHVFFSPQAPRTTDDVNFNGGGTGPDHEQPQSYAWDFGDGTTGTGPQPTHRYSAEGDYRARLTVTFPSGQVAQRETTVSVDDGDFWTSYSVEGMDPVVGEPRKLTAFVFGSTGPGTTYAWDFGDGSKGSGAEVTHTWQAVGDYEVKLTVKDGDRTDTYTRTLVVRAPQDPQVSWHYAYDGEGPPPRPEPGSPLTFRAQAFNPQVPGDEVKSWSWTVVRGTEQVTTSTAAEPTFTFAEAGAYEITVRATFASGATATYTDAVRIRPLRENSIEFYWYGATKPGGEVSFEAFLRSQDGPDGSVSYSWNFGDGATGTGANPRHTYGAGGTYKVTVTATTASGTVTRSQYVDIKPDVAPSAGIAWRPERPLDGNVVRLWGAGLDVDDPRTAKTYAWSFGDGAPGGSGEARFFDRSFPAGTHEVTLTVTFDDNSTATRTRSIEVKPLPPGGETVSKQAAAGETVSTPTPPSPGAPVQTSVKVPVDGPVTINEVPPTETAPSGYGFFGQQVDIMAPDARSPTDPIVLTFGIHTSAVPAGTTVDGAKVYRDGTAIERACPTAPARFRDLPCVASRSVEGEVLTIVVHTMRASAWNFGAAGLVTPPPPTEPTPTTPTPDGGGGGGGADGGGGGGQPIAPPTPTPAVDRTGPVITVLATNRTLRLDKEGAFRFRLGAALENMTGQAVFKTNKKVKRGKHGKAAIVALGKRPVQALQGQKKTIVVRLSKANVALVRKLRTVRVQVNITARDPSGNLTVKVYRFNLKPAPAAKKKRR
jgi:PKD repeat protein